LKPGEPLPEKAKIPSKHLGVKVAICQAISIARRYGWTIVVLRGTSPAPSPRRRSASRSETNITLPWARDGMYASCREAGARFEEALAKYDAGEYAYVVAGPLGRANFIPDTVLVYGTPPGAETTERGPLPAGGSSNATFPAEETAPTSSSREEDRRAAGDPAVLRRPDLRDGRGRRDGVHLPLRPADEIVEGLERTHAGGVRYPIPIYLRFQADFPKSYQELEKSGRSRKRSSAGGRKCTN